MPAQHHKRQLNWCRQCARKKLWESISDLVNNDLGSINLTMQSRQKGEPAPVSYNEAGTDSK